jgi:hypothetical protein
MDTTNYALYVYTTAWHLVAGAASVASIAGTANQITASASTGAVTLSISSNPIWPGTASETIPLGTTAQRPGSPTVAMLRYNTTEDIFEGYATTAGATNGYVESAAMQKTEIYRKRLTWEDDFVSGSIANAASSVGYGALGWTMTASSGTSTNSTITGITDHPGILSLGTPAATNGTTRLHFGSTSTTASILPAQVSYFAWLILIPTITTMTMNVGLGQDISAANMGTAGVYFQFAPGTSANWQFFCRSGSTQGSGSGTTIAVVANTWYFLEAWYNGTIWQGSVNGTLLSVQTTNIPTVALNVGIGISTTTGTARTVQVDYFGMYTKELGNRF